jgi:FixJ family two-component response regulator
MTRTVELGMVLLIDDDEDFRQGLAGVLRDDGFTVLEYGAAHELPSLDSLAKVCLLITDYQLPGQNGLDLADQYHAVNPSVPIVLVTAHWSERLEAAVAARPYLHLCRKPLDYTEIEPLLLSLRNQ